MHAKIFFYPVFIVLLKLIIFVSEITGKICALIYFYKDGSIEQNCILKQGLAKWYRIGIIEPDHIGEFPSRSGIDLKWFSSVKILLSVEEIDTYKKQIRIEITDTYRKINLIWKIDTYRENPRTPGLPNSCRQALQKELADHKTRRNRACLPPNLP